MGLLTVEPLPVYALQTVAIPDGPGLFDNCITQTPRGRLAFSHGAIVGPEWAS